MPDRQAQQQIDANVAAHNRVAEKYEKIHGEIFNDIEQDRLRSTLERALAEVQTGNDTIKALDVGCGSGNLTGHLLSLGAEVTAADVSRVFLDLVKRRYPSERLNTLELDGRHLGELRDGSFDIVGIYSVLHHIPDYLGACAEMARVCRKGGVIVIDHEASPNVWKSDADLDRFRRQAMRLDWRKYARLTNYVHRFRRIFDPKYSNEGDIHVWPDDHIEWDAISRVMRENSCEVVFQRDYLLYRRNYRRDVFDLFRERCADTRVMAFRRMDA